MGNNGSSIAVTFDRAQPSIYFSGETITGQVRFMVTKSTAKIDEIFLRLSGDVGYTTTRTARIQNGQTERITDCHDIRILGQRIALGVPVPLRQHHSELSKREKSLNMEVIEPGEYKYPFSFRLPDTLPPTLHPENYPFVRYHLQVGRIKVIAIALSNSIDVLSIDKKGFNREKVVLCWCSSSLSAPCLSTRESPPYQQLSMCS